MINSKLIAFAIEAHQSTNHLYDGKPYSFHLAMAAHYAQTFIHLIPNEDRGVVMGAVWLHDVIEDCRLTYNDVAKVAGSQIADIVYALTNDKGKTRKERASAAYYEGIRSTPYAVFVKMCDRMANVHYSREMQSVMFEVYKQENESFIFNLFAPEHSYGEYRSMVRTLDKLLIS